MGQYKQAAMSLALICFFALGTESLLAWRTISMDSIGHVNATHGRVATWFMKNTPKDARVAAFDIGRISYEDDKTVIDLGGLIDPTYLSYMQTQRAPDYLASLHAEYVVFPSDRVPVDLGFANSSSPVRLEPLTGFCTRDDIWKISITYTHNHSQCQGIYRIDLDTRTLSKLRSSSER